MLICRHFTAASTMVAGCLALALSSIVSACFSGQVDPDQSGVFACITDQDCDFNSTFRCLDKVCTADEGPQVSVVTPTVGQIVPLADAKNLVVTIRANDLELAAAAAQHEAGKGYLEVLLDERRLGTIVSGDLKAGVSLQVPADWTPISGVHRVAVQAMKVDGTPYRNSDALAFSAFWIDDGLPRVGIFSPHPLQTYRHGDSIDLVVKTINFRFIKANAGPAEQDPQHPVGHLHAFFNPLIPDCLGAAKSCKDDYFAVLEPPVGPATDEIHVTDLKVPLTLLAGKNRLSVVAQNSNHTTFPSNDPATVVYDTLTVVVEKRGE